MVREGREEGKRGKGKGGKERGKGRKREGRGGEELRHGCWGIDVPDQGQD